jgi:hypothetical protein
MVVVHSATKGLAAMTLAVAHSRGWLDYEERVAAYWPEFAQNDGPGLYIEAIRAELNRRGVRVPFLAHDLMAEIDGRPLGLDVKLRSALDRVVVRRTA